MNDPRDTKRGWDESDVPWDEEGRCNTRALDLGAVRAIHKAAQGARPPPAAVERRGQDAPAPERPRRAPPAPRPTPASASSAVPPSPVSVDTRRTVEVDYSPASRLERTRSERVRAVGQRVLVAIGIAALGLGLWAVLIGRRTESPLPPSGAPTVATVATPAPTPSPLAEDRRSPVPVEPAPMVTETAPTFTGAVMAPPPTATAQIGGRLKAPAPSARRPLPRTAPSMSDELPNQ